LHSRPVFSGKILNLRVDTVLLPDGRTATREVVEHSGAVVVAALNEAGEVIMVRQFRHPVGRVLLELPAGKLDAGEEPLACAKRELLEETGYEAEEWVPLYRFFSTPGFSTEEMHLFLATNLRKEEQQTDDDEFIEVVTVPLKQTLEMIERGDVCDAKSIVGLLALCLRQG